MVRGSLRSAAVPLAVDHAGGRREEAGAGGLLIWRREPGVGVFVVLVCGEGL